MFKEYFVVARYVASIPSTKDMTDFVLDEVVRDMSSISPNQIESFIKTNFSVLEGNEINMEDIDNDE